MRYILSTIIALSTIIFMASPGFAQQGEITGQVVDKYGDPVPFATVGIQGSSKGTTATDSGFFTLSNLNAGNYDVEVRSTGFNILVINEVGVIAGNSTTLNPELEVSSELIPEVDVIVYKVPLIDPFRPPSSNIITTTEIKNMPVNEIGEVIQYTASVTPVEGGGFSIRGGRPTGNAFFVDGIRVMGEPNLPARAVYSMEVIPGGIPAKYGDLSGGVVIIETGSFFHNN